MKVKSFVKGAASTLLAAGVALSCASVANAVGATYYPISSGSINGGYYSGSYNVTATSSSISVRSFNKRVFCLASQNGANNNMEVSAGVTCSVQKTGNQSVVGDYVSYDVRN